MRILTILVTAVLTLVLLIGGSSVYKKIIYTNPLEASLSNMPAVTSFAIEKYSSHEKLKVNFSDQGKLKANFYNLLDQLETQSNRVNNLTIEISNNKDSQLEKILSSSQLPIYEAISTGKYSQLTENLAKISTGQNLEWEVEMDDKFIFLTTRTKDNYAHMVIKRADSPLTVINTIGGEYL